MALIGGAETNQNESYQVPIIHYKICVQKVPGMTYVTYDIWHVTYLVFDGADGAAEEALHQGGRQYEVPPSAPHVHLHNQTTAQNHPARSPSFSNTQIRTQAIKSG